MALAAGTLAIGLILLWSADSAPQTDPTTRVPSAVEREGQSHEIDSASALTVSASQRESAKPESVESITGNDTAPAGLEPGAMLIVRVVDKTSGAPLPRVRIAVRQPGRAYKSEEEPTPGSKGTIDTPAMTGADGLVEFALPAGSELSLSADGEAGDSGRTFRKLSSLSPGERREITLELPSGTDLHYFGRVVHREDQAPIPEATIEPLRHRAGPAENAGSASGKEPRDEPSLVTDSDGRFDVWLRSWEDPDLEIRAAGYGAVILRVGTEHDTPEKAKVVFLSRSATLHARLTDAAGGPLLDGAVRLWVESYYASESDHGEPYFPSRSDFAWRGKADSHGLCVLQDLPAGFPFHVEILRGGRVVKKDLPTLSLDPGELREVEWSVGTGCRLEGSVVDQHGKTVPGITIWLMRADSDAPRIFRAGDEESAAKHATSDSDGRFGFADVSPAKWWVGPAATRDDGNEADPEAVAPFAWVVEVLAGSARQELTLRAHRGLYIRGSVLDPAGKPARPTYVWGHTDIAHSVVSARTAEDGSFAIGPLMPGRYSLVADGWEDADSERVEAQAGDEAVVLRLRTGGTIHGVVIDETGKGCAARVLYCLRSEADKGFGIATTKKDGAFEIPGLDPGTYDLAVTAGGQRAAVLRGVLVDTGGQIRDVSITLAPGSTLRVRYAGTEGYLHYRIFSEGTTVSGDGVPAGGVSQTVVPSGHLVIECIWPGSPPETRETDIAPGEDKVLVFGGGG